MRIRPSLLLLLLWSSYSLAIPPAPPSHSVSPDLQGLNISYMIKKDRLKITLYVVNHEDFEVVCDAEYTSGPEKQEAHDKTIPPNGKADSFRFVFGRRGDSVHLRLLCINPETDTTHQTAEED